MDDIRWPEVMERLSRIRMLADRAGTLAEAEAATAALSRLLLRYNLSLADIDDQSLDARGGIESQDFEVSNSASWRHYLLHALAQGNFCRAIRFPGTSRAILVGHPHNIAAVKELYRWLSSTVERLASAGWEEQRDREAAALLLAPESTYRRFADARSALPGASGRRAWTAAFRTGAVDGLWRRMLDERESVRAETPPEQWALVPLMDAEVQSFMDEFFSNIGSYKVSASDPRGYSAGHAAGYAIDVTAPPLPAPDTLSPE